MNFLIFFKVITCCLAAWSKCKYLISLKRYQNVFEIILFLMVNFLEYYWKITFSAIWLIHLQKYCFFQEPTSDARTHDVYRIMHLFSGSQGRILSQAPCQTSMIERFCENNKLLKAVNCFRCLWTPITLCTRNKWGPKFFSTSFCYVS